MKSFLNISHSNNGMLSFENTSEISIPKDPLEQVIGQDHVVEIARIITRQKRHLLMVGPPGTGKSFIASSISTLLPKPQTQISIVHNPYSPERPTFEILSREEVEKSRRIKEKVKVIDPRDAPFYVSEVLGFRCKRCGTMSDPETNICLFCGSEKYRKGRSIEDLFEQGTKLNRDDKVVMKKSTSEGKEEDIVYERSGEKIKVYKKKFSEKDNVQKKIIVSLERNCFVQATGASETELLGDVRHDPYAGHHDIGVPVYERVLPGAVHEAHEGVLFIDELSTLGDLQRYLLTAMQNKKFPIMGRNTTSSGAAVRVDDIPCDFIFIGAINTTDISGILPPLRSRIIGGGYEVLLNTVMEDNEENQNKLMQFIAQEIIKDTRIPHADYGACLAILEEARFRAFALDKKNGISLRLRDLSGIIKMAGDFAMIEDSQFINKEHVRKAITRAKTIEEQLMENYDNNMWKAGMSDYAALNKKRKGGYASEVR